MVNMPLIPSNSPDCPTFTLSAGLTKALTLSLPNLTFTDPKCYHCHYSALYPIWGEYQIQCARVGVCVCVSVTQRHHTLTLSLPSTTPVALEDFTVRYQARLESRCCSIYSIDVIQRKFPLYTRGIKLVYPNKGRIECHIFQV